MSTQSSTTVACRAVVMLACLVAIPLAAMFGTPLRRVFQSLLAGRWDASWVSTLESLEAAQPFGQQTREPSHPTVAAANGSADNGTQAPRRMSSEQLGAGNPLQPRGNPAPPLVASTEQFPTTLAGEAIPANYQASIGPPPAGSGEMGSHAARSSAASGRLVPVTPLDTRQRPAAGSGNRVAPTDQFVYIQKRLRQLGATYYLLESWGDEGQLYRFYCKMAVGGNPDCIRFFEATDADALQAMAKVLTEVETWKNDRW